MVVELQGGEENIHEKVFIYLRGSIAMYHKIRRGDGVVWDENLINS